MNTLHQDLVIGSVNEMYAESFKTNWDRPSVSNYPDEPITYGKFAEKVARFRHVYEHIGLRPGDKVAICSRNNANWGISFIASMMYGAVPVSILSAFKPATIHHLVNHSEARILLVEDTIWEHMNEKEMPGLLAAVNIFTWEVMYCRNDNLRYVMENLDEEFSAKYPQGFGPDDIEYYHDTPEELCLINYTSGSSGFSKGVMIPYRAVYSNAKFGLVCEPHVNNQSNILITLPVAHVYGFNFDFMYPLSIGAHMHFLTKAPSPRVLIEALNAVRPDYVMAVPLVVEKLYKAVLKDMCSRYGIPFELRPKKVSNKFKKELCDTLTKAFGGNFEEIILGGAAPNHDIESFLHEIGFRITVGYGMTECAPIVAYQHYDYARCGSVGLLAPGLECKIMSDDPEHKAGELYVRGRNVFLGYFKSPEETKAVLFEDGWMNTGDMAIQDKDGFIYLMGRSKCMILGPNGQNIYPEEIESVINAQSGITDSLVLEDHERLVALIVPDVNFLGTVTKSNAEAKSYLEGLIPKVNELLPSYSQIAKFEIMPEDFERTPKGSIKRYLYQRK